MSSNNKGSMVALVLGAVFLLLGIIELSAMVVEWDGMNYISDNGNLMMGLVLLLVGATFLFALRGNRGDSDREAFIIVGCMLGVFVGLVALLTLAASASETYLLGNEEFVDWVPADDFTPAIIMMFPCLAVLWYELKKFRVNRPLKAAAGKRT